MHVKMCCQITINAPADKVWKVIAHDFEHVAQWASGVAKSGVVSETKTVGGAKVGGRFCVSQSPSFGIDKVQEVFTHYDEATMRFGYKAISGLPASFKSVRNNWSVWALSPSQSVVHIDPEMEVHFLTGILLNVFRLPLKKLLGDRTLQELKYFVENDTVHPRKLKELRVKTVG
jgi:Polyketide cyclase / dehydrase and lipid transport